MAQRKRLLVAPTVEHPSTLHSLLARVAHYLSGVGAEQITIPTTPQLATGTAGWLHELPPPPGIDPGVAARIHDIFDAVQLVCSETVVLDAAASSDVLAFWDTRARTHRPWESIAKRFRAGFTLFDVDWRRTADEATAFADLAYLWSQDFGTYGASEVDRFRLRTERFWNSPNAFVVGSGSSADDAFGIDLSAGVRLVGDRRLLDTDLMEYVRPDIVILADPILNFGPSTFANQFRRVLAELAQTIDFTIVTLERFAGVLRNELPAMSDRIVGVRLGRPTWQQNYSLMRNLVVRECRDVMTMLMLPLAATFSRSIKLIGFDENGPSDVFGNWRSPAGKFERELDEIRLVHPGFVEHDRTSDHDEYVDSVERSFLDIELRGGTIETLGHSSILPLRRRVSSHISSTSRFETPRRRVSGPLILSVTPDWTGDFGHFGPWERAIGAAARASGYEFCSLASRGLVSSDALTQPIFTHGASNLESFDLVRFEDELRSGLDLVAGSRAAMVGCYAADVWQLHGILQLASERPSTTFAVNLMRCHDVIEEAARTSTAEAPSARLLLLRECLNTAAGTNVHICLDTKRVCSDLEKVTGTTAALWPMSLLTDPRILQEHGAAAPQPPPVHLVAFVRAHKLRGLPLVAALADRLRPSVRSGSLAVTARLAPQLASTGREVLDAVESLKMAGVTLSEGNLPDSRYASLLGSAHVVLVPYSVAAFRARTSGVVLDAAAAGRPIVATKGTWAGDLVEDYGLGATFDDGDVDSLEAAVRHVIQDLVRFARTVESVRPRLIAAFSPSRVVTFLASLANAGSGPPDPTRLGALRSLASLAVAAHWYDGMTRDSEVLQLQLRLDDLTRSREA